MLVCILFVCIVCILLNVVSHYDLNVLSMSVMGFQKKTRCGWVGGVSTIHFFLEFKFFKLSLRI